MLKTILSTSFVTVIVIEMLSFFNAKKVEEEQIAKEEEKKQLEEEEKDMDEEEMKKRTYVPRNQRRTIGRAEGNVGRVEKLEDYCA